MIRNNLAAIAATVAVVIVVVLGFRMLGSPASQRLVRSDVRVVGSIAALAEQIHGRWNSSERPLPVSLEKFDASARENPVTHEPFIYRRRSDSQYELCAKFATDSREIDTLHTNYTYEGLNKWAHPKGEYCFQLDASERVPQAPYIY